MKTGGERRVYSLLDVTQSIGRMFEHHFKGSYWIKAEIASLNYYPKSGHCYPNLVQKEKNRIKAQMRGRIWAGTYREIQKEFIETTGEPLKEGMQILFLAGIEFHPLYGLSLNIKNIDPAFTLGELTRQKQETINRLKKEGLFDRNKQLPLPLIPKSIAVISVTTSKGWSDFLNIINNNPHHYTIDHRLYEAILQGDQAAESIRQQLKYIEADAGKYDMVLIIRGGGGEIGLTCYDNYSLARAVALFPLPVLTGIGHSTNETVVQMVANKNLITPTDIAYFLLNQFEAFDQRIERCRQRLHLSTKKIIDEQQKGLAQLTVILKNRTGNLLNKHNFKLHHLSQQACNLSKQYLHSQSIFLNDLTAALKYIPKRCIDAHSHKIEELSRQLTAACRQFTRNETSRLQALDSNLQLLKPENVLKRGYSITLWKGKALRDLKEIKEGDEIETILFHGKLISSIKSKSDE